MAIILLNISLKEFALISDKPHGFGKHYTHRMYQTISHFYETKFNCTIFYNLLLVETQRFRITRSSKLRQNSTKTFIPSVTSGKELMTGIFQPKSFRVPAALFTTVKPLNIPQNTPFPLYLLPNVSLICRNFHSKNFCLTPHTILCQIVCVHNLCT